MKSTRDRIIKVASNVDSLMVHIGDSMGFSYRDQMVQGFLNTKVKTKMIKLYGNNDFDLMDWTEFITTYNNDIQPIRSYEHAIQVMEKVAVYDKHFDSVVDFGKAIVKKDLLNTIEKCNLEKIEYITDNIDYFEIGMYKIHDNNYIYTENGVYSTPVTEIIDFD